MIMTITLIILLLVVLLLVVYLIAIYNHLVKLRNRFENAFSQIDVQLKRRYELIPNLVETTKGYLKHERETLQAVTEARNRAASASDQAAARPGDAAAMQALVGAETALTGSLGRLFALYENYPDLKADLTIAQLMEELGSTENRVSFARQAYNDAVMVYNTYREQFPNIIVSNVGGYPPARLFEIESEEERRVVRVSFA